MAKFFFICLERKMKEKIQRKMVKFKLYLEFSKDIFFKTILSIFSFCIFIYFFYRLLLNIKFGLTWREKTAFFFDKEPKQLEQKAEAFRRS